MTKIHILSDSPKVNSGFAIVAKNIAIGLNKLGYDVTITGIQTSYIKEFYNGIEIYPLVTDDPEDAQFSKNLMEIQPNLVIYVGDQYTDISYLSKIPINFGIMTISHNPVEGKNIPKSMIDDLNYIAKNGKIVPQCKYGLEEMKRCGVNVEPPWIYHGFNPNIFRPIDLNNTNNTKYCYYNTEIATMIENQSILIQRGCLICTNKKDIINNINNNININQINLICDYFKEETIPFLKYDNKQLNGQSIPISKLKDQFKNKFIYLFVGANHALRKKIDHLFDAYSILIKESRQMKDKTHLHIHANPITKTGLNLLERVDEYDIRDNISFTYGKYRSGISEQGMSILYNIADVFVSATSSEGMSIPHLEAMACGLPCISPDTTSMTEIIGNDPIKENNRGYLAKTSTYDRLRDGSIRYLVDIKDLSSKMKEIYTNKSLRDTFSKNAIEWSKNYSWDKITLEFDKVIKSII